MLTAVVLSVSVKLVVVPSSRLPFVSVMLEAPGVGKGQTEGVNGPEGIIVAPLGVNVIVLQRIPRTCPTATLGPFIDHVASPALLGCISPTPASNREPYTARGIPDGTVEGYGVGEWNPAPSLVYNGDLDVNVQVGVVHDVRAAAETAKGRHTGDDLAGGR